MAIGIVSSDDFDKEWRVLNNIPNKKSDFNDEELSAEIININRGRGEGKLEVPESLREVIAEDALVNGNDSAKELARAFDISDSSVSAYKNGATSTTTYNEGDKELKSHTDAVRQKIGTKARARLLMAMNSITKDKLQDAKLRDVASVANAMSNVIRNIEGPTDTGNNQTNFIFYAPKTREESAFEVINLKE